MVVRTIANPVLVLGLDGRRPATHLDRTLSLRTSAAHPKAVVPLSRGGVGIDPECSQGIARQDPATEPVGRPLILAEKGLEMRPRGHLSVTRRRGPTAAPELWVNLGVETSLEA